MYDISSLRVKQSVCCSAPVALQPTVDLCLQASPSSADYRHYYYSSYVIKCFPAGWFSAANLI